MEEEFPRRATPCTAIVGAFAAAAANGCCGFAGSHLERPFAHLYETGGTRRAHLRGHINMLKPLLIHAGGFNLGLLMPPPALAMWCVRCAGSAKSH